MIAEIRLDVNSLTYVGAGGRKLMRKDIYIAPGPNFNGEFDLLSNHGTSNYDALQAQYRHRLSNGLQTLLSYTWGHSIDDVSSDANYQNVPLGQSSSERGPSDYDIQNTFSGAVSYDIPGPNSGVLKQVFGSWSTDSIIYARSAPSVNVVTGQNPYAGSVLSGTDSVQRPDIVPNVPSTSILPVHLGARVSTPRLSPLPCPPPPKAIWDAMRCADSAPPSGTSRYAVSSDLQNDFRFRREEISLTSSITRTLAARSTTSAHLNSAKRQ